MKVDFLELKLPEEETGWPLETLGLPEGVHVLNIESVLDGGYWTNKIRVWYSVSA